MYKKFDVPKELENIIKMSGFHKYLLGTWKHYKGADYKVIGVGRSTIDASKQLMIYKQLKDSASFPAGTIWVRPKDEKDGPDPFFAVIKPENRQRFRKLGS